MIRILLLVLLSFLIVRALRTIMRGVVIGVSGPQQPPAQSVKLVRDPICGTHVTPRPGLSVTSRGTTYFFCSEKCREQFRARG